MSKAKVTIGRYVNTGNDRIYIEITDVQSGATFVHVELSLADFAMAVTGLSMVNGEMELHGLDVLGKERQMKHETVSVENVNLKYEDLVKLAAPFEVDGWRNLLHKGSRFDVTKNKKGEMSYTIPFVRWITVES